jgi:hypothetical protein
VEIRMARDRDVTVWLSTEELDALDRLANAQDRSRSGLIRRLVRRELAEHGLDGPAVTRADPGRIAGGSVSSFHD